MQFTRWLLLASLVASGIALTCLERDPDDPSICRVFNSTSTDDPKDLSPVPTTRGPVLSTTEKAKLAFEIVGGTLSALVVIIGVYKGLKAGDRWEDIVARVHPFLAQLREIWRRHPATPQTDLIDLWSIGLFVVREWNSRPGPSLETDTEQGPF